MRTYASLLGILACVAGCAEREAGEDDTESESSLTGGTLASDTQFAATVLVFAGQKACTAARVGPRHVLLAAHCVHDFKNKVMLATYAAGAKIRITASTVVDAKASFQTLTVESARVHKAWRDACAAAPCPARAYYGGTYAPDVGLVVVKEEISAAIATAMVDVDRVRRVGDRAFIGGYGKEDGGAAPQGVRRHEFHQTAITSPPQDRRSAMGTYFATPGLKTDPKSASTAAGDSAGPVYRDAAGTKIIGVKLGGRLRRREQDLDVRLAHASRPPIR